MHPDAQTAYDVRQRRWQRDLPQKLNPAEAKHMRHILQLTANGREAIDACEQHGPDGANGRERKTSA